MLINRNGTIIDKTDSQDRILSMLYGTVIGRMLLKPLTHPFVSRIAGRFLSTKASCVLIKPFIKNNNIDMTQFEDTSYGSYNEFFCRKIRPELRPVDKTPSHFISPCDSKLTVLPISEDTRFVLKHTEYSVASLLKNDELVASFSGGYAMIFRLTVDDYHRYCYVADGTQSAPVKLRGALHTVNPIANDYFPIYKENCREYSILRTTEFGDILMMEVGALLVGKIVNHPNTVVSRGQEKGYFQFGGSTVVLLTQADTVCIDEDILQNSARGLETIVKYGEKIGTQVSKT